MAYKLIIKEEAVVEAKDAFLYYEMIREGLGEQFLKELEIRYSNIVENPQYYSKVTSDVNKTMRDVKLKRFPFVIIFDVIFDAIVVYSVHNSNKELRL